MHLKRRMGPTKEALAAAVDLRASASIVGKAAARPREHRAADSHPQTAVDLVAPPVALRARRSRRLQADQQGPDPGRVPARVHRLSRAPEAPQAGLLRRHRRRGGPLPARSAPDRHGRRLHRLQTRQEEGEVPAPLAGAGAQADLRRLRLPRAGDAGRPGDGWLLPGWRGSAPPRHGQKEGRSHGQGAQQVRRGLRKGGASAPKRRARSST
jgi:hypothetical protein